MQSRKSDSDVDSICEISPSLTSAQILKLIKSYTPDDCEDSISPKLIEKLSAKLAEIKGDMVRFLSLCYDYVIGVFFIRAVNC